MSTSLGPVLYSSTKSLPAAGASDSTSLMTTAPDAGEAVASMGTNRVREAASAPSGARQAVFKMCSLIRVGEPQPMADAPRKQRPMSFARAAPVHDLERQRHRQPASGQRRRQQLLRPCEPA